MASAWGASWGPYWGNAFGSVIAVPIVPVGLAANPLGSTAVQITVQNGGEATSYTIDRRSPSGSGSYTTIATGVTLPFTNAGLTPSTNYGYRILGTNAQGSSAYSAEVSVTTPAAATGGRAGCGPVCSFFRRFLGLGA